MTKLTLKQENFCREYISNGGNASEAYRTVYNWEGSEKNVRDEAQVLMANPIISPYIEQLKEKVAKKYDITIERVLDKLEYAESIAIAKLDANRLESIAMNEAKLGGLIVEKKTIEVTNPYEVVDDVIADTA